MIETTEKRKTWCPRFKDIEAFHNRVESAIVWGDWIRIGTRLYKQVEYGDAYNGTSYVMFQNKKTRHMIQVDYDCPSYQYVNGVKVQTKHYRYIGMSDWVADELYRY